MNKKQKAPTGAATSVGAKQETSGTLFSCKKYTTLEHRKQVSIVDFLPIMDFDIDHAPKN